MVGQFEFEPRDECVCGARLPAIAPLVVKRFAWGEVRFARCPACGSWCQSPQLTAASLALWSDSPDYQGAAGRSGAGYADYAADENNRIVEARARHAQDLIPLLPSHADVLEIGCASGSLLAVLREHGHRVTGIDLSERFAQAAKKVHGIEVQVGDFMDLPLAPARFDAILAMGTVSNLRGLVRCLQRMRDLVKPGGCVIFNFPDADSLWVRAVYRQHFWMFTPSVNTFMSARGCRAALERSGHAPARLTGDVQRPSLRKLLHHGKADFLLPLCSTLVQPDTPLPFSFPVPAVRLVVARHDSRQRTHADPP